MKFELYDGEVTLAFDERKHVYTVAGKPVVGVTTVTGVINKNLTWWASRMAVDHIKSKLTPGQAYDEIEIEEMLEDAYRAHSRSSMKAASIGTMVHSWIENWIAGAEPDMPVNKKAVNAIEQFLKWVGEHDVKFLASEQRVYSRKHRFAGTFDFTAEIDGKVYLGDIKTSSGIYPEYFVQTGGYDLALLEEKNQKFHGHIIINTPKEGDFKFKILERPATLRQAFLGALNLYNGLDRIKKEMKA